MSHHPYVDEWRDVPALPFVVMCRDGSCLRGSEAPTILGSVATKAEADEMRSRHIAETAQR